MYVVSVYVHLSLVSFLWRIISGVQRRRESSKSENLDYVYDRNKVASKAGKTEKLLIFLGSAGSLG